VPVSEKLYFSVGCEIQAGDSRTMEVHSEAEVRQNRAAGLC